MLDFLRSLLVNGKGAGALQILNTVLPSVIALYREVRDQSPPGSVALTDQQIIDLLEEDSQALVDKADAWLAAHPEE
jgi:hypothetical protein